MALDTGSMPVYDVLGATEFVYNDERGAWEQDNRHLMF
jgi:hypothetical protein